MARKKSTALFLVVGREKERTAYYAGWWHTYNQPLFTNHPLNSPKKMSRANANRVRRRLEDPVIWGGEWRIKEFTAALEEVTAMERASRGA